MELIALPWRPRRNAGQLTRMRIYLDFDGVLHGVPYIKAPFELLPAFEAVLRTHPKAEVVITSSWREEFAFEEMRTWFAEDVRRQIIGVTPIQPDYKRVHEIRAHVRQTGYRGRFIVIDDAAFEFPKNYRPLVLCDTRHGLRGQPLAELQARLAITG